MARLAENERPISETVVSPEPSLEAIRQRWATALEAQREGVWAAVGAVGEAIACTKSPKERRQMFNILASDGHCTSAFVRQHFQLHEHYGERAKHLVDVSFALLRACTHAAKRTGQDAMAVLTHALKKGWHASDVAKLGRKVGKTASLIARCPACGVRSSHRISPATSFAGLRLQCSVCIALAKQDKRDVSEAEEIGVLE